MMIEAIEASTSLNERVEVWVEDTRFVLDQLRAHEAVQRLRSSIRDLDRVAVTGMSIGGAVAGEFCKVDARCVAGINVDGLQYGLRARLPLEVPFLTVQSDDGAGTNEFSRLQAGNDYYEYHFVGSRHPDFTDLPLVWPWMRHTGQLGSIPSGRVSEALNSLVRIFLDRYLIGSAADMPGRELLPELRIETREAVRRAG